MASWNHSVYGIERATGEVRGRFRGDDLPGRVLDWIGYEGFHVTPEVVDGRVYVGNRNTWFHVLDARTGQRLWGSKVGASWIGSPALVHGDQVFYALFGHDQRGRQTLFYGTGARVFARPALHEDVLLVGALTGHLFAVDAPTGEGRELLHLGPVEKRYAEYSDPATSRRGCLRTRPRSGPSIAGSRTRTGS